MDVEDAGLGGAKTVCSDVPGVWVVEEFFVFDGPDGEGDREDFVVCIEEFDGLIDDGGVAGGEVEVKIYINVGGVVLGDMLENGD